MSTTLIAIIESGKFRREVLDRTDRIFLKRWAEGCAGDPIWSLIVADALALYGWEAKQQYLELIWYALDARRVAAQVKAGIDPILQKEKQEHARMLSLAEKAEDLARYFAEVLEFSGIAAFYQKNLELPVTPEQKRVYRVEPPFLRVKQLRDIHEREARLIRQRASWEPKPRTFISRKKGKREVVAFIYLMSQYMKDLCGKPHNRAVAMLADMAFGYGTESEDVRKILAARRHPEANLARSTPKKRPERAR
jgi:hypothetical protein